MENKINTPANTKSLFHIDCMMIANILNRRTEFEEKEITNEEHDLIAKHSKNAMDKLKYELQRRRDEFELGNRNAKLREIETKILDDNQTKLLDNQINENHD